MELPPLSLYIHIPWCVRKCPYCDFNSHQVNNDIPVDAYIQALKEDLDNEQPYAQGRRLDSIFIGGGTPSLFPAKAIATIIEHADKVIGLKPKAEITLEANPGTVEHDSFKNLRAAGVNRLSLGIQSFHPKHLTKLGRIHSETEATQAVTRAQKDGFDNINLDLMHGLPGQTLAEAQNDLQQAIALSPQHISWYQLTIEQNTEFYSKPPVLPQEDLLLDIIESGQSILANAGYRQYEVSAYALEKRQSQHNLNYWRFGDYLAIGAGAHGKITPAEGKPIRYRKTKQPNSYLDSSRPYIAQKAVIDTENLALEFMMNALRLNEGVHPDLYHERTRLNLQDLSCTLNSLQQKGLIEHTSNVLRPTPLGRRFLNTILESFI